MWRTESPLARRYAACPPWLRALLLLLVWVGLPLCGLLLLGGLHYWGLAQQFNLDQVGQLPRTNVIIDRNGVEFDSSFGTSLELIDYQQLPPFLVQALLAREDAHFFQHPGIDVVGLARATVRNLKDRKFTQGASTLSMQLARNVFEIRAKSMHRKFLEIALTLRIEQRFSKKEILAGYLNRIYFGVGAGHLGVQDAARHYFNRSVSELNEGECALLMGIIRGPHIFSPWRDREAAVQQQGQVLQRMVAENMITAEQVARIRQLPLRLTTRQQMLSSRNHAVQVIENELGEVLDEETLQLGGLRVMTTLDLAWQKRLERELLQSLATLEADPSYRNPRYANHQFGSDPLYLQCAAVSLDSKDGGILALLGGRDYAHSLLDRSRKVRRDLGTAFEPFVAAAAAERGQPVMPGQPVSMGRSVGDEAVQRIAKRCGLKGPFAAGEDLFRGAVSATPMEMAIGLATLASGGYRMEPYLITAVYDAQGNECFRERPQRFLALSRQAAKQGLSVLSASQGSDCFTGATGSEREAWTLRVGPRGSTAIWVGFDQPRIITHESRLKQLLGDIVDRLDNQHGRKER